MAIYYKTDAQILELLGELLEKQRIASQLQDKDIMERGGVTKDALSNFKHGRSVTMGNFIKIMRGAGLLERLPSLFPLANAEPVTRLKPLPQKKRIIKKTKNDSPVIKVNWSE